MLVKTEFQSNITVLPYSVRLEKNYSDIFSTLISILRFCTIIPTLMITNVTAIV